MKNSKTQQGTIDSEPRKRLSLKRLALAIFVLAGLAFASVQGWERFQESRVISSFEPWFAPYVDVTAFPNYPFEQPGANRANNVVLSFIVSSVSGEACTPTWGGVYTIEEANSVLDLDRRIARYRQQSGNVAISFGGLLNDELAVNCADHQSLKSAYLSIIDHYRIDTIDLDLEGLGLTDLDAAKRRAEVIAEIQKEMRENDRSLAVWVTLPVAPQGLTQDGTNAIAQLLESGVDLAGVNVMTMNYGSSRQEDETMSEASIKALTETHRQLGVLYKMADIYLNDTVLWSKIGSTPMIGQNDVIEETFTVDDAIELNLFATTKGLGRMSMWSANRDITCGDNYVNTKIVSDSCSGIVQNSFAFSDTLKSGFSGNMAQRASLQTIESPEIRNVVDIPEESPYQIWSESATYLAGTKVVWRRNVYQAKWWTRGDVPDNPVLQSWETPWQIVGPVLPGETPIPRPTLSPGAFPSWSGSEVYDAGQIVLYEGVPYEAKWWTQGDSPAASTANPDGSPWVALTQKQIEAITTTTNSR